ncbi:MAG: cysteine dioxygenase family protein [Cocleimonas sp.]|nr:cysteine dioxygenase family protein [Cocleimonas sp.]
MKQIPQSLQRYIQSIESHPEKITPQILEELLQQSQIDASDLIPWIDLDHPIADSYGRKMVYEGEHFEVMVMSWRSGDFSAIHDHGSAQWGVVQYFGELEHRCFYIKDGIMKVSKEEITVKGQINRVSNSLIHHMGNTTDQPFLSLHTYGTYGEKRPITQNARIFEFYNDEIQLTNGGVFFLLPDHLIHKRIAGIKADKITLQKHYYHLLMRAQCNLQSDETSNDERDGLKHISNNILKQIFSPRDHKLFQQDVIKVNLADGASCSNFWCRMEKKVNWQLLEHTDALDALI